MPIQLSTAVRTSNMGDIRTALGANFTIEIRSGAPPASCAAADAGTLLASFTGCNFATEANGAVALSGVPYSAAASGGSGTAPGHFRMKAGGVCHVQGTVAAAGADMTVDVAAITAGQTVNLTGYTLTAGGA